VVTVGKEISKELQERLQSPPPNNLVVVYFPSDLPCYPAKGLGHVRGETNLLCLVMMMKTFIGLHSLENLGIGRDARRWSRLISESRVHETVALICPLL
jgi:hypothetical protein